MNARRTVLSVALIGAAALAVFGDRSAAPGIAQSIRPGSPAAAPAARGDDGADGQILALIPRSARPTPATVTPVVMFGQKSWAPPPPPPPAAVVEKPVAPPVPYQYVGKKFHDGQWTLFLAKDGVTLLVKAGDVLDESYRVQSIDAGKLVLHYLPLKEDQTVAID